MTTTSHAFTHTPWAGAERHFDTAADVAAEVRRLTSEALRSARSASDLATASGLLVEWHGAYFGVANDLRSAVAGLNHADSTLDDLDRGATAILHDDGLLPRTSALTDRRAS